MRPPSGPLSRAQLALAVAPDYYYKPSEKHKRFIANGRTVPELKKRLDRLNMQPKASVVLQRDLHSKDVVRASATEKLASCSSGPGLGRTRSAIAKGFINAGFSQLPETHPYAAYDVVAERIGDTCRWENMGPEMALGRLWKYYPKKGALPPLKPPNDEEALRALADCGLVMLPPPTNKEFYKPYPLRPTYEGEKAIRVSKKSYNGLPTEGTSADEGAMRIAHQLAVWTRENVEPIYRAEGLRGVDRWVRRQREKRPYLTTFVGRAKDDCYTTEKYDNMMVRFYNVVPRPLLMVMQQATQPFVDASQSALDEELLHSMCGVFLAHGGAERVVRALQEQLETDGYAFLVQGDDSWVVIKLEWKGRVIVIMFALDCASFDLTQRWQVRDPTLRAMSAQIELFDGSSAGLWLSLMRERDVVVAQSLNYTMKDGGPSGGPGQSEINSQLMSIYIRRIVERIKLEDFAAALREGAEPSPPPYPRIKGIVEQEGAALGFTVKLEQYYESEEPEIKEILRERPFLFLGYYFHVIGDTVAPFCDLARTMATTAYPSGGSVKDKRIFNVLEAYRIGGVVVSMGVPPLELSAAYEAMRMYAGSVLRDLIMDGKEIDLEENPEYTADCALWPKIPLSLLGLYNVILKRPERLWLQPPTPQPLPENSPLLETMEAFSWGLQMDEEDEREAEPFIGERPPGSVPDPRPPAAAAVSEIDQPLRGVTPGNHGRPPPTASRREGVSRPSPHLRSASRPRAAPLSAAELVASALEEADSEAESVESEEYRDEYFDDSGSESGRVRGESMGSDEGMNAIRAGAAHRRR